MQRARTIGAALAATLLATSLAVACARDSAAQGASSEQRVDDAEAVRQLLAVARGIDPVLCELLTRTVDMHGSWTRWGRISGNPLEFDSASARLLTWVQRPHRDASVVPALAASLRDGDACVRRVGASLLARVEHPDAIRALTQASADANPATRHVATLGLGLSDAREAFRPLLARLADEDARTRTVAAWGLGVLEQREALPQLVGLLERDRDPRVRQAAAWALGKLK